MADTILVEKPHPASLDEKTLLKECTFEFGRTAGPGGQHRNKVETAVCVTHDPTGMHGQAGKRRKQQENRSVAIRRLRMRLARKVRTKIKGNRYEPSDLWKSRRQGEKLPVSPTNRDYPALLAEALDVIVARKFDVAGAAGQLGVTMSQLARLVRHDRHSFAMVNEGREERGLHGLR